MTGVWAGPIGLGVASAALFGTSLWVPPIGFLFCLLAPLPIAVAALRGGTRAAGIAAAAGAVVATLAGGILGAGVYLLQFAAGGALLGLTMARGNRAEIVVGSYAAAAALGFGVTVGWLAATTGAGPLEVLRGTIAESVDQMAALLLQNNADPQLTLEIQTWAEQTGQLMERLFPGLYGGLAILVGWGNALLLRRSAMDRGVPAWITWRAPEPWIWVLIGTGLAGLVLDGAFGTVALNVFAAALVVYFLQGLAIVQHLFITKGFPKVFRVAAYALLFLQFPVMILIAGVGAFDMWLDFRARWTDPPPAEGSRG